MRLHFLDVALLQDQVVLREGGDELRSLRGFGVVVDPLDCSLPILIVAVLVGGDWAHLGVDERVPKEEFFAGESGLSVAQFVPL